jgi:hypothetical protein
MFSTDGVRDEITRDDCPPEVVKERTGFNPSCLCLDCMARFEADLKDEAAAPRIPVRGEIERENGLRADRRALPQL